MVTYFAERITIAFMIQRKADSCRRGLLIALLAHCLASGLALPPLILSNEQTSPAIDAVLDNQATQVARCSEP